MVDTLIIGFDGADPELLDRWINSGHLPTLETLQEHGTSGSLRSTPIPITPCAWTTALTGKNPGKHGIFDFTRFTGRDIEIVSFADMDEPTVFELMDEHSVGTLNIPATYPPRDLDDGFMVSGMMTPHRDQASTDEDVLDILEKTDYQIEIQNSFDGDNEADLVPELKQIIEKRTDTAINLIDENDPDVFMTVYTAGDRASHWFWHHMDETHPDHTDNTAWNHVIRDTYQQIDTQIERLLEHVDDDTQIIILSDHGFTGLEHGLNLNNWLLNNDYIQLQDNLKTRIRATLFNNGLTLENSYAIARKLKLTPFIKHVADNPDASRLQSLLTFPFLSVDDIDWDNTDAVSAMHFGPIFMTEENEKRRDTLIEELQSLEHDDEPVIDTIKTKEDLFHGNNLEKAPDIIYRTTDMKYQTHRYFEFGSNTIIGETHNTETGHHAMDGILIINGPDVPEQTIENASLKDIAPTLLQMTDYLPPDDMDGESLL